MPAPAQPFLFHARNAKAKARALRLATLSARRHCQARPTDAASGGRLPAYAQNNARAPGIAMTPGALVLCYAGETCRLFLAAVTVTAHEFIHAAGGIDKFLFAGEEGVA